MTTAINKGTWEELAGEVLIGNLNPIETYGRMCLESPEVAIFLSGMGSQAIQAGAVVYEAMQRQIRKDALAALERSEPRLLTPREIESLRLFDKGSKP